MLGGVVDMIVGKRSHRVVAVVIIRLISDIDSFLLSGLFRCSNEVFWQQLTILVEIVSGTL
jgi:hypothetical protein